MARFTAHSQSRVQVGQGQMYSSNPKGPQNIAGSQASFQSRFPGSVDALQCTATWTSDFAAVPPQARSLSGQWRGVLVLTGNACIRKRLLDRAELHRDT